MNVCTVHALLSNVHVTPVLVDIHSFYIVHQLHTAGFHEGVPVLQLGTLMQYLPLVGVEFTTSWLRDKCFNL